MKRFGKLRQMTLTLSFVLLSIPSQAQETDPSQITIERSIPSNLSFLFIR